MPSTAEPDAWLRWSLRTPRGNTAIGVVALLAAVLAFALVRWLDEALATGVPEAFGLVLSVGLVCALALAGLVLLARPARRGLRRATLLGVGAYLALGVLLLATGIPGYVSPGAWYVVPTWPMLVIWLHACTLGVGLWPCPAG